MDTRTVFQVKRNASDVIWHIGHAARTLEHAMGSWANVTALLLQTPEDVQKERLRCMNVIGVLCDQLARFLGVMNSREEIDPEAMIKKLIESCDIAMEDRKVNRLVEKVSEMNDDKPPDEKPPEQG